MNCTWLKERLPRPEVELWRHGRPSSLLLEHARTCSECGQMIEDEACVKSLLLSVKEATLREQASPEVRAHLLGELELRSQLRQPKRRQLLPAGFRWALAAAAAIVLATLAVMTSLRHETVDSGTAAVAAPTPAQPSAKPVEPAKKNTPVQTMNASRKKKVAKERPRQEAMQAAQAEQQYYPLMMCDAYTCGGDAIEVEMKVPSPSLWLAGSSRQRQQGVNARFLVGEDGIVRAIKFEQ